MPTIFHAPVEDTKFVLGDILEIDSFRALPGFGELDAETIASILEEGGRFAEEVLHPLNGVGDVEGCTHHPDNSVTTPKGFREAYKEMMDGGWAALSQPVAFGGQGLPYVLGAAIDEYMSAANMAFSMYPGLTNGAVSAIAIVGSDAQKKTYLPKMVRGTWSGTMNLTEPQAGTDLGLVRTKAVPGDEGTWKISGTKIFISAGEHDLTENIIHLVLARTPDAPEGTHGISLFLVPKFLVDADGSPGTRNSLSCGSIEDKMGIHGSATCVMNYDEATGYLLGEENKGLQAMFIMMNIARLSVGVQGLSQSEIAYQNAAAYVKERVQGRAPTGPADPEGPADPLIVQPDVRRNLLDMRAFNEGSRMLALWGALLSDLSQRETDENKKERAADLLAFLTPVIKAALTDGAFENAVKAQQMFGGHGYIRETGIEQIVRDARITMIYEGANAVQALDLVGRKLPANGGRALKTFLHMLGEGIATARTDAELEKVAGLLDDVKRGLEQSTMWLQQHGLQSPSDAAAAATDYLELLFHAVLGHLWLKTAVRVRALLQKGEGNQAFLETKLVTARHYFERMLPMAFASSRRLMAGSGTLMELPADRF